MEQRGVTCIGEDGQVAMGQGVAWSPGCLHSHMGSLSISPFLGIETDMYNLIS